MRMIILLMIAAATLHASLAQAPTERKNVVACVFTNWAQHRSDQGKYEASYYRGAPRCTHLLYAYARVNNVGHSFTTESNDVTKGEVIGLYEQITDIKNKYTYMKMLLSYGGPRVNNSIFEALAKDSSKLDIFAKFAISHMRKYNFDGMDLSWRYPSSPDLHTAMVKTLYQSFVQEAQETGKERLLLSISGSPFISQIDASYDPKTIAEYLDFVFVSSYSLYGYWDGTNKVDLHAKFTAVVGSKEHTVEKSLSHWVSKGMPKYKIVVGIPAFAQGWTLTDPKVTNIGAMASGPAKPSAIDPEGYTAAYWEICKAKVFPASENTIMSAPGCFLDGSSDQWYSYDRPDTAGAKANWILENGYGGAFVWSLDTDDFHYGFCKNGTHPILDAVSSRLYNKPIKG